MERLTGSKGPVRVKALGDVGSWTLDGAVVRFPAWDEVRIYEYDVLTSLAPLISIFGTVTTVEQSGEPWVYFWHPLSTMYPHHSVAWERWTPHIE